MKSLIVASNNQHKIKEIKEILKDLNLQVISLKEAEINIDVEEDGKTFIENSRKKAIEIAEFLKNNNRDNFMVMADDSGLVVDCLDGAPGVYSARYAGEHGNDRKNNEKLIENMKGIPFEKRTARFECAIVLITDDFKEIVAEGRSEGYILKGLKGEDGFGYDPLFFVPQFNKTFAEMTSSEKNSISHRGRALDKLKERLVQELV
ncbi:XTP/dITP diphosphatase [Inconstantimicrobium mannanitabidum]|uniref:Non-canonical purine NTP pyrophosphatase n=1 Tax=Inconstantimicrobium mannanitabidum TaxID=1604901 RepID=A0ACB5R6Q3_9CLOT|nr:XTP/dITP diphosphatase [Clostridium sp. TW13]GKX64890.1 non-canonical purine NTP pyrophosphatase [Clostridium sp. TW13]